MMKKKVHQRTYTFFWTCVVIDYLSFLNFFLWFCFFGFFFHMLLVNKAPSCAASPPASLVSSLVCCFYKFSIIFFGSLSFFVVVAVAHGLIIFFHPLSMNTRTPSRKRWIDSVIGFFNGLFLLFFHFFAVARSSLQFRDAINDEQ